jgi:hypothetical protein
MVEGAALSLEVVDARELDERYRALLRPGELLFDREGRARRLPRFFYEVPSWEAARAVELAPHFAIWEFMDVDVGEAKLLRAEWPRYVPCAVALLASALEVLREEAGTFVHISANGGYRSPAHRWSSHASTHCWGTAANIYRIGNDWLDDEPTLTRYRKLVRRVLPAAWVRPYGPGVGEADDHLHLDLGYLEVTPHGAPGEEPNEAGEDGGK